MLFLASFIAYMVAAMRVLVSLLIGVAIFYIAFYPVGITPLSLVGDMHYLFFGILFFATFIPFVYITFDFIFGFTTRNVAKDYLCFMAEKVPAMRYISIIGYKVSKAFNMDVEIVIEKGSKKRAYSMGSLNGNRIYISLPLIAQIVRDTKDEDERNYVIGAFIAEQLSHLSNYNYLPMMIIKGSDALARIMYNVVSLPLRLWAIPIAIIPFARKLSVYIFELFVDFLYLIDKVIFKFFFLFYKYTRYDIFDKKAESYQDYQTVQAIGVHFAAMMLTVSKKIDDITYAIKSPYLVRLRSVEKVNPVGDIVPNDRFLEGVLLYCVSFIVSSGFGIAGEIWLFPMFFMEHLVLVHQIMVTLFALLVHFKDMIFEGYKMLLSA